MFITLETNISKLNHIMYIKNQARVRLLLSRSKIIIKYLSMESGCGSFKSSCVQSPASTAFLTCLNKTRQCN